MVALTLSVGFDNNDENFGASDVALQDMVITTGAFQGKTVAFVLAEANKALAGCPTSYSLSQLHEALTLINESFVDGVGSSSFIMCPPRIPIVTLRDCPRLCVGSGRITLSGGQPEGGTYFMRNEAGTFVAVTTFDPVNAGDFEVIYQYTDPRSGCRAEARCTIRVNDRPRVTLRECPRVCVGSGRFTLSGGEPSGGTYFVNGAEATTFDPQAPGDYELVYRYTDRETGCRGEARCIIRVNDRPRVTLPECPRLCVGSGRITLTGGQPEGGTYFVNGVEATTFNPEAPGNYELVYRYTDRETGCRGEARCTIVVNERPRVTLRECPRLCVGSGRITLSGGEPAGGTYFVNGVEATTFNPESPGDYELVYRYTDRDTGCRGEARCTIRVVDRPRVTLRECPRVCVGSGRITLSGGEPAGGTYFVNGEEATTFNPEAPGNYELVYRYTDRETGCRGEARCTIVVNERPRVTLRECPRVCVGSGRITLSGGEPAGGTYFVNGQEATTFNPENPGEYELIYRYTDRDTGCRGEARCTIRVYENPRVRVETSPSYCVRNVATVRITATASGGSGSGYTFDWTVPAGAMDPGNVASFDATVPGTYSVVVTDDRRCTGFGSVTPRFDRCRPLAGCTPGYWKNHHQSWGCGYEPGTSFFGVFGISQTRGLSSGLTLDGALNEGGGGYSALVRHATAALLNACHNGVNYPYERNDILQAVASAFNNGTATLGGTYYGSVEALKNELDRANNLGCPLNNSNFDPGSTSSSSAIAITGKTGRSSIELRAFPNPFTESATLDFTIGEAGEYSLVLHDMKGRLVRQVSAGKAEAGRSYSFNLDGSLPAGIYLAKLRINNQTKTIRIMHRK
ncbi:T9SS type A sorting domain-containing protein [Rufibacter glacialis]|uniref:T9SS type A sorting domain-containing protein n=1 Tax=Rufibacter glacialis TaxID=1259555 RepID=A0ABV4RKU8_9BACT|nr:T9SS type A sorting domain-containing protein [Rufibacter glacialis]